MVLFSFVAFLLIFIGIGALSSLQKKGTGSRGRGQDYLIASRDIKPWLVALSLVATNNSGYMFMGMIGYTYMHGLSSLWIMLGWIAGDLFSSFIVHKKFREFSGEHSSVSYDEVLSSWSRGYLFKNLQKIIGIISVTFLGAYAAAQFSAGGKALHVLFGWNNSTGILIGATMVLIYCLSGGIRASIWTDAAQSIVMIIAMVCLLMQSINAAGGVQGFTEKLRQLPENYLSLFPSGAKLDGIPGLLLFALGWCAIGFGVFGQPHIMVRLMTVQSPKQIGRVRAYYYILYTLFYAITIGVGMAARILLPDTANFDPELALPSLASQVLPPVLVGLMIAGIFAATMSTADSQILSCSASISRNFKDFGARSYLALKLSTLFTTVLATFIALFASSNVFNLVMVSWSATASAFCPLILIRIMGKKPPETTSILMLVSGIVTMFLWKNNGLGELIIQEIVPGILVGCLVYFPLSLFEPKSKLPTKAA